ncbi:unnamed protein product [Protopolystoma xenopodis]|uniref:Deoxynucleoside kinase domain-containing protein n=1 Tax=Protopolystoma xenopodis TaxID=117903 RepID=A0A3S5CEG5_9PLAT|nr:unnamed protein product [Protopolystoma xenopodis]
MCISKKFSVIVEGNIGCGKSTFLRYFDMISSSVEVLQEPINMWKNVKGFNLFELMYQDIRRWAVPFQACALSTLLQRSKINQNAPVRLLERSLHSSRYCFVEAIRENGDISEADYRALHEAYQWGIKHDESKTDLFIYLRSSPRICLSRIKQRNRPGEECIPLAYLEQLHKFHDELLLENKYGLPAPIIVFDCDESLEKLKTTFFDQRRQVLCGVE